MESVSPLPAQGTVFFDPRDEGRFLRVSYHDDLGVFVLSLWRDDTCLGSFRLATEEAPRLIHAMVTALVGEDAVGLPGPSTASPNARTSVISAVPQRRENA